MNSAGADSVLNFSNELIEETFTGIDTRDKQYTITLKQTPKKIIILQAANHYGVSFPANANLIGDGRIESNLYYSYSYNGI